MPMHDARTPAPAKPEPVAAPRIETTQPAGGRLALGGDALLQLQRRYGNRYVQQVVGRAREAPGPGSVPVVQAKLLLGPASDRYEREADRVAARITGHPAQRRASEDSDAQRVSQPGIRQLHGAGGGALATPVAQDLQRARGRGQPLRATLRRSMEQALGADFSGVRVHTGAQSDQLNRSLQAAAFTSGQDIFFRRGAYAPASPKGAALLTHELTHVVQQRDTIQRHFDPPAQPAKKVTKQPNPLGLAQKPAHQSKSAGWAISKEVVPAQELLVTGGVRVGHKVTRFTALLTPAHQNLSAGVPTRQGFDPLGWAWVERNEVRSRRGALRYWIRFHLLNAKLGGKGTRERHLVPTTKTANARWDVGLERKMTAALKGANATPVYYDVKLTYWALGAAPTTYVDAVAHTDYSANITLFPRSIEGNWKRFEKNRWVDQPSLTVTVDKPRGISGEEAELTTHQNLGQLAKLFHIDEDVLTELRRKARTISPGATYGHVREILETWAMAGTTPKEISARQEAIFESDGYLRTALAGGQSFKLKIGNQHVPDDATPEARMYGPPVHVRSYQDLGDYQELTSPITIAYMMAQQHGSGALGFFPQFEEFLWLMTTKGPLYPVLLSEVQRQWDDFKAANESLPPIRDMHRVPDQDEVLVVLQRRTQQQVVQSVRDTYAGRIRAVTGANGAIDVANELARAVDASYGHLLRQRFHAITVEQADNVPRLAQALLDENPVRPLAVELNARLAAAPDLVNLGITGSLQSHPFSTSLTVPLAAQMGQLVTTEQQRRQQAALQAALQQAAQQAALQQAAVPARQPAPQTRRHPIPTGRPGSPGRLQHGTPGIRRDEPAIHPDNQRFITALRASVLQDQRYTSSPGAQQGMRERMNQVEQKWKKPAKVTGLGSLGEDLMRALKHVFNG